MPLTNITILKYNNYYNRLFKQPTVDTYGYNTVSDYINSVPAGTYESFLSMNFHKADGINSKLVVNTSLLSCDYLIESDNNNYVLSRWFIIESNTTRTGQTELVLRRDLFVDFYDEYVNAPSFIEKATVGPNDIAIYNQEDITFNEVKKSEDLLKDTTGVPWIVGYCAYNSPAIKNEEVASINVNIYGEYTDLSDFYNSVNYDTTNGWRVVNNWNSFTSNMAIEPSYIDIFNWVDYNYQTDIATGHTTIQTCNSKVSDVDTSSAARTAILTNFRTVLKEYYNTLLSDILNEKLFAYKAELNNAYVKIGNAYKKVTFNVIESAVQARYTLNGTTLTNYNNILDGAFAHYSYNTGSYNLYALDAAYNYTSYYINLEDVTLQGSKINLAQSSRKLQDAPYKMFAIPAGELTVNATGGSYTTMSKEEAINIGISIAKKFGGNTNYLYDLQLLPYCPFRGIISLNAGQINVTNRAENIDFNYITNIEGTTRKGIIVYPPMSSFTFNISKQLFVQNDAVKKKIANQCDKYRLCSPNYAASFDFNVVKTGNINKINVDCTYKPYNPYIHVNPVWAKLYGEDYNDARGLVCQGDFSIPIISDAWTNYQINNKNYLNAFNRQVETIELKNKYQKINDVVNAVSGTFKGAEAGAKIGPAGTVMGTALSAAAGGYDVYVNEKLRNDALDLQKDQFNYNLQNIEALPNTLAKISSFDYNNKLFPILEYYSCTDDEKTIFESKLKYNGMSVMRISENGIAPFIPSGEHEPTYIKGQFIRLTDLGGSFEVGKALADEFNKGVYM